MTDADREAFALEMTRVAEHKGIVLTEGRLEGYWEDLAEYDLAEVAGALRQARKELVYFPQVPEVIERIRAARAERRAVAAAAQKALAQPPPTAEEMAEAAAARQRFLALIRGLGDAMRMGAGSRRFFPPLAPAVLEEHERRKQAALGRLKEMA